MFRDNAIARFIFISRKGKTPLYTGLNAQTNRKNIEIFGYEAGGKEQH